VKLASHRGRFAPRVPCKADLGRALSQNVTRATSDRTRSGRVYPQYSGAYRPTPHLEERSGNGRRLFRNRFPSGAFPVPRRNDLHPIAVVMRRLFVRRTSPMMRSPCATAQTPSRCSTGATAVLRSFRVQTNNYILLALDFEFLN